MDVAEAFGVETDEVDERTLSSLAGACSWAVRIETTATTITARRKCRRVAVRTLDESSVN